MVEVGGGVECFYHTDDGESCPLGLDGGSSLLYSHRVGAMYVAMVASMVGLAGVMRIFARKMDQRLMAVTTSLARHEMLAMSLLDHEHSCFT
jgi:hypothetical protein